MTTQWLISSITQLFLHYEAGCDLRYMPLVFSELLSAQKRVSYISSLLHFYRAVFSDFLSRLWNIDTQCGKTNVYPNTGAWKTNAMHMSMCDLHLCRWEAWSSRNQHKEIWKPIEEGAPSWNRISLPQLLSKHLQIALQWFLLHSWPFPGHPAGRTSEEDEATSICRKWEQR